MTDARFRYCEGCGTPTGLVEHKPKRLCDECGLMALWAEPGDEVEYRGVRGVVAGEPCDTIEVLVRGRLETWPTWDTRRLATALEGPTVTVERRPT